MNGVITFTCLVQAFDGLLCQYIFRILQLTWRCHNLISRHIHINIEITIIKEKLACSQKWKDVPSCKVIINRHAGIPLGHFEYSPVFRGHPAVSTISSWRNLILIVDPDLDFYPFGTHSPGQPDLHARIIDEVFGCCEFSIKGYFNRPDIKATNKTFSVKGLSRYGGTPRIFSVAVLIE